MAASGARALWKNSACLILGSGPIQYLSKPLVSKTSDIRCYIVDKAKQDPEYLFVKRSNRTGFMANVHVFPGGVVDNADSCKSWRDLFSGYLSTINVMDVFNNLKSRASLPIHSAVSSPPDIPGEVATRICAIRETFEETGVLLLRSRDQLPMAAESLPGTVPPAIKILPIDQSDHWRRLVHSDARNFIVMCRELECVPDVFSLVEWADWLTPSNYFRRFDTVFYLCCSESKPAIVQDNLEISEVKWLSINEGMRLTQERELMFSPPQFIEITKLLGLGGLSCVHSYGLRRARSGLTERIVAVRYKCLDDVIVSVVREDDLYPVEASEYKCDTVMFHHCRSPTVRDIVKLRVVLDTPSHEYECISHTSEELEELSSNVSRVASDGDWYNLQANDNVFGKELSEHLEQYEDIMREHPSSKL